MHKLVATITALTLAAILPVGTATAAEPAGGNIPTAVLADIGLSGMVMVSDEEALDIRGKGGLFGGGLNLQNIALNVAVIQNNSAASVLGDASVNINVNQTATVNVSSGNKTPKNDVAPPKNGVKTPKNGVKTPKNGVKTPKNGVKRPAYNTGKGGFRR